MIKGQNFKLLWSIFLIYQVKFQRYKVQCKMSSHCYVQAHMIFLYFGLNIRTDSKSEFWSEQQSIIVI